MTDTANRTEPDKIERDVRRTQDEIGRTVDKLEEKLTPREISRSVIGDDGTQMAEEALEVTRTNPIPVALIAIGIIWLIATSRSGAMRRVADRIAGKGPDRRDDQFMGRSEARGSGLRPRVAEPAPIGPPPPAGEGFDRSRQERSS
jgi:hypothetical protein